MKATLSRERRQAPRSNVSTLVSIFYNHEVAAYKPVRDLSTSGAFIEADFSRIRAGQEVLLRFRFHSKEYAYTFGARVVHVLGSGVGVQFQISSPAIRSRLLEVLAENKAA